MKDIKSASELTFFICQLMSSPLKSEFQEILNENDIEARMINVADLISKEVQIKIANKAKFDAMQKRLKNTANGGP